MHRLLAHVALALLLLVGQQGAAWHAVEHLAELAGSSQEKQLPQPHGCDKCASYAKFGSAVPAWQPAPVAPAAGPSPAPAPIAREGADRLHAYSPRAPPHGAGHGMTAGWENPCFSTV